MNNIIQPDSVLGTIEYNTIHESETFTISEGELVIEKISGEYLFYTSAVASHYEIHGEHKVYVADLRFDLLMPVLSDELTDKVEFQFPKADSNHPLWEKTICSNFFRFEHLLIVDCSIKIERTNDMYKVEIEGAIDDSLDSMDNQSRFNCKYTTQLTHKIDRTSNYFLEPDN